MKPYFHSISEFITMGGHGFYVWACWISVFIIIMVLIFYSRQQRKNLLMELKRQHQKYRTHTSHTKNATKDSNSNPKN